MTARRRAVRGQRSSGSSALIHKQGRKMDLLTLNTEQEAKWIAEKVCDLIASLLAIPDTTRITLINDIREALHHYRNKLILHQRWWCSRGYPEGIPDEGDYHMEAARRIPSWRRICKSLLRNDWWCKGLGFTQQKSSAYSKYLDLMRRRREGWGMGRDLFDVKMPELVDEAKR